MTPTEKAIAQIESHERECAVRYESIEKRLDSGSKRFDRLEMMIWGVYATVIVAVALPQLLV
jgi:predicted nucleic acid-binding Zn ribbon protein|tara:strand:- start:440 stop:625 length:186 start_codon:yes stop_codon:yes gene_type:complete